MSQPTLPGRREIAAIFLQVPDFSRVPERIRETIRRREWANEILLRVIQLTIILMFCAIYTISPKTGPADAFTPTPYVLGAYLVLSMIGLVWGLLREPPEWSVYISILFDFGLLYGLMIGFHFQYDQPASFILKAPALLYVFIFIAIRALRFRARFVLAAGGVAALGWAVVIFYVTWIDPGDNMLTRSYVEYLTANRILIGAEIDKIMSILFVTAILALAVNASTNLMITAVTEKHVAEDFSRFFDSGVAEEIRTGAHAIEAGKGERREITIVNIDLRGFTRLSETLQANEVMEMLTAYRAWLSPHVQREGGVIDKFMGDGVMAVFGVGDSRETFAADAVRMAESLLAAPPPDSPQLPAGGLQFGIGIATGDVTWGAIGQQERLELTVIGPAANLSAKLEKHNKVLGSTCICDRRTWELAVQQGYQGQLSPRFETCQVEGVSEAVEIARLQPGPAEGEENSAPSSAYATG